MNWVKRVTSLMLSVAIVLSGLTIGGVKSEAATAPVNVWDKYDTKMVWTDGEWEYQGFSGGSGWGYPGYRIDDSGRFVLTGEWGIGDGYRYEFWSNGWLNRYQGSVEMINGKWESGYHWWYQRYAVQKPVRGNLIQSNLVGAYPDNGLHTDGYWYVKKTINNNLPVLTISSSGDKQLYNDGGTFIVSGTVQDADNDSITISASIGGVTKTTTVTGTSTAKSWSLTWSGTELPVGVYTNPSVTATDGKSPVTNAYNGKLTVLAQVYYYWSKFNVTASDGWTLIDDGTVSSGIDLYKKSIGSEFLDDFAGWSTVNYGRIKDLYNSSDGFVTGVDSTTGSLSTSYTWNPPAKYANNAYETYAPIRIEMTRREYGYYTDVRFYIYALTTNPPKDKGSLIQANIKAVQGTYPDDGIHSDGYWYVKAGQAPNNMPTITVNQAGNKTINLKSGSDTFTLTGTVLDADNDTLLVQSTVGGVTKQVAVSNAGTSKTWTLTWRNTEFNAAGDVTGIQITADDGRGGVSVGNYTGKLTIDKTPLYYWDKYSVVDSARGSLLEANILDLNGTYPDNGIHSDGYWYVKKATSNMFPVITVESSDIVANQSTSKVTLRGTASDADGDTVTLTATLAGVAKSTSVTGSGAWQLEWPISEVPEGVYSRIPITGNDGNDGIDTITYTGTIIIDKTAPVITVTPDQQTWTSDPISLTVRWSDQLSGLNANERKYKLSTSRAAPASWDTAATDQLELSIPGEGEWYLHTKAADQAGNEVTTMFGPFQYQLQPEVPVLKVNSVGAEWAEVGWSLPSGSFGDGYQYEVQNTVTGQSWTVDYPTDHVREETLNAGTTYQYRIKAKNHVGESEWSEQFEVLTLPAAAENLKVSFVPNNSGTVNVSFDAVDSAESYLLTIKEGMNLVYEEELSAAGTHQVTGLEGGKQYTVSVTAKNASGAGQSSVLGFLSLPAAPGEFQSAQIRETEVELSWNASPTASLYELLRDAVNRYSGPNLSYTDTGLESGTEYDYSISATNESGFGDIAYLNGVLTLPGKTELKVEDIKKDVVSFSIKPIRGAERYVVLANGLEEKELPSDTEQFEVDSLTPGTEYTFEVYAENRSGAGSSDKVTVRTLPDKPDALTITGIGETTAKVSWEPVQGADKYKVTVTQAVYFEVSGTEVVLNDLLAGTTYQPKVQAGNASGYGEAAVENFLTLPASPNVRLKSVQANQFTLTWDEVASAQKYVIYSETGELIGETEKTEFSVTSLKAGETCTIYVSAVNDTGEGKKSSFTQRTLPAEWNVDPNGPEASQPINIGDRDEHSVVIIVDTVEGADQYKIVDGDGNVVGIITAPETAKEIGGLESAKEYDDWTIIPINDAGEGQAAPVPPFVTLPSSDFTVSVVNPTTSSLTISIDSQLTNEVFVYAMGGKELHRGKDKSFTVSNLSANKSHTFTVWTENSAGDKTEPKSVTGQTLPVPSSGGTGGGGITLKPEPPVRENEPTEHNSVGSQSGTSKPRFQDIDSSFAKYEILALYDKGIVKGVSDSKFEPDRQVTRVEFASMLVRAMELQEASDAALTFEDVQRTAWYVPELSAAVLNGVAKGISVKEFRPFDPITREQAAKMIANAAYQGNVPPAEINFSDASLIAFWAKPEVAALTTEQVITGYPDQTFKPKRDLTRAECAVLIYRSLGLIK